MKQQAMLFEGLVSGPPMEVGRFSWRRPKPDELDYEPWLQLRQWAQMAALKRGEPANAETLEQCALYADDLGAALYGMELAEKHLEHYLSAEEIARDMALLDAVAAGEGAMR